MKRWDVILPFMGGTYAHEPAAAAFLKSRGIPVPDVATVALVGRRQYWVRFYGWLEFQDWEQVDLVLCEQDTRSEVYLDAGGTQLRTVTDWIVIDVRD